MDCISCSAQKNAASFSISEMSKKKNTLAQKLISLSKRKMYSREKKYSFRFETCDSMSLGDANGNP